MGTASEWSSAGEEIRRLNERIAEAGEKSGHLASSRAGYKKMLDLSSEKRRLEKTRSGSIPVAAAGVAAALTVAVINVLQFMAMSRIVAARRAERPSVVARRKGQR